MSYRCKSAGAAALPALLLLCSCDYRRPATREWAVMGTFATVSVPFEQSANLDAYVREAREVFSEINDKLTVYTQSSELAAVNRAAGSGTVAVGALTGEAVAAALKYAALSDGYFDPTVAPLVRWWGFNAGSAPSALPEPDEMRAMLARVGFENVRLAEDESEAGKPWRVELALPGMSLDLGGAAKGFAVDKCFERLRRAGAADVMINLGGNIRCGGVARPDRPWRIGVRNPFDNTRMLGVLLIPDGWAVATSGNYERYVVIDGKRYTHIIDPRTGYPVAGMAGVTVAARTAFEADAMSTAFFVMGPDEAARILPRVPGCEVLFVLDEQPPVLRMTPGFAEMFEAEGEFSGAAAVLPAREP